jgi:crossover junction endodeoxyribonuclease RuvC
VSTVARGPGSVAAPSAVSARQPVVPVRILGIDPGSRMTGYGIIETTGNRSTCVAYGRIHCEDGPLPQRLLHILAELGQVIREYLPTEAGVEEVFVKMNVSSALVLGQARGAAICALAQAGLTVAEYAPARIKSAIVGHGRADKKQIQHMVRILLDLDDEPPADAADALAVALCHAHLRGAPALARIGTARRRAPRWRL